MPTKKKKPAARPVMGYCAAVLNEDGCIDTVENYTHGSIEGAMEDANNVYDTRQNAVVVEIRIVKERERITTLKWKDV